MVNPAGYFMVGSLASQMVQAIIGLEVLPAKYWILLAILDIEIFLAKYSILSAILGFEIQQNSWPCWPNNQSSH